MAYIWPIELMVLPAGQGIITRINAALSIKDKPSFILTRADAYIGVMIDDLIN